MIVSSILRCCKFVKRVKVCWRHYVKLIEHVRQDLKAEGVSIALVKAAKAFLSEKERLFSYRDREELSRVAVIISKAANLTVFVDKVHAENFTLIGADFLCDALRQLIEIAFKQVKVCAFDRLLTAEAVVAAAYKTWFTRCIGYAFRERGLYHLRAVRSTKQRGP